MTTPNRPQPQEINDFHELDDVDVRLTSHHHTLGPGANQASAGNHTHPKIGNTIFTGYLEGQEITEPVAPATNTGRLYFRDNAGKTQLVVRFPTGAVQVIATEP